jgi:hypothetical protein
MNRIDDLMNQLAELRESDAGPFPYPGCRRLTAAAGGRCEGLISDLDFYLNEFAGYRSWGRKILSWSDDKLVAVEKRLGESFFERFSAYFELKPLIAATEAADVRHALHVADRTREVLQQLLPIVRGNRSGS